MKIGFSDIGGIDIAKNIQTDQHLNHSITIAVSFSQEFEFWCEKGRRVSCTGLIIQANTIRKFVNPYKSEIAFIHIEPFSQRGLKLTDRTQLYKQLTSEEIKNIVSCLKDWLAHSQNTESKTADAIVSIFEKIKTTSNIQIDPRVEKAINIIRTAADITLTQISQNIHLSPYRFSHLFRQQTGVSSRKFVLYTKLVKAIKVISQNESLTRLSYFGGFADQAHFTRTFYNAFGILPSRSVK